MPLVLLLGYLYLGELVHTIGNWAATAVDVPRAWLVVGEAVPDGFRGVLTLTGGIIGIAGVIHGLRALSRDHLIRVSSLLQTTGKNQRPARPRQWMASWVGKLTGGQSGRGGYEYVRTMMFRDWQFRRQMALNLVIPIVVSIMLLVTGLQPSPFERSFAPAHFLPHLLGIMIIPVCLFLAYGNDHKGVWSFCVVPESSFDSFARGVHAALWGLLVAVPSFFWLLVLAWSWGVADAVFFIAYCASLASLYLGAGLRLINGVPFGKRAEAHRGPLATHLLMILVAILPVVIGLQYLIFQSHVAAGAATFVVGLSAYATTRLTLNGFASRLRASLRPEAPGTLFRWAETQTE